jgi:two-component system response regulator PrrA
VTVATQDRMESLSADVAAALGLDESPLRIEPLVLWPAEGQCSVDGRGVHLSQREFDLLAALAAAPDRIIRRERLYELVWGQKMPGRGRDVDVYVRKVRVKLADAAPAWAFIHTHHQVGYRLSPEKRARRS